MGFVDIKDVLNTSDDSDYGYMLEVDLRYPLISILASFRPVFNPLEGLGYPSNEYFSFHTVQVYL